MLGHTKVSMSTRAWHRYGPTLAVLVAALVVLIVGPFVLDRLQYAQEKAATQLARSELRANPILAQLNDAFEDVARAVEPSVVHITVEREVENVPRGGFLVAAPAVQSQGSGWVYDDAGHVVTNHHVVEGAGRIEVRFTDGMPHEAELIGSDESTDIAVLRVRGRAVVPAVRATGKPVSQGDFVFAFGSPFGFEFSMSSGIVSGQGRQANLKAGGAYENYIQTDAAINPGNSGGPLTNIYGEVVGMNIAIAVDPNDPIRSGRFTGVGLAIPLDMIEFVVTPLIEGRPVQRGGLGIDLEELRGVQLRDPGFVESLASPFPGLLITNVLPDSPAARAGLERHDVIVSVNDTPVRDTDAFRSRVHNLPPGSTVTLGVWRQRARLDVDVVLGDWARILARSSAAELGVQLTDVDPDLARSLSLQSGEGVYVESVVPRSPAASLGLVADTVIVSIDGRTVGSAQDFLECLAPLTTGSPATIVTLDRAGRRNEWRVNAEGG